MGIIKKRYKVKESKRIKLMAYLKKQRDKQKAE